jgi:DNA-binding response OmpR family regulator
MAQTSDHVSHRASVDQVMSKVVELQDLLIRLGLNNTAGIDPSSIPPVIEVGRLRVDVYRRLAFIDDKTIELSPMEAALLIELARHPEEPISAQELGERAWPQRRFTTSDDVRRHIYRLRQSLDDQHREPPLIRNRRGVGYMLEGSPAG